MLIEFPIFLAIFIIILMVLIISIALYSYDSFLSEEILFKSSKITSSPPDISIKVKDNKQNAIGKKKNKTIKIKGFHKNEITEE